ncbi:MULTISPECIES: GNAT family N-acetyltransferase [unclassified Isoptericola]|uniref:GNAT family N-acetyltransferase n=1 Tax=unclassified Isoptericola TaxID=2623355 RepID=UPI00365BF547
MTSSPTAAPRPASVLVRPARVSEAAHVAWLAALTFPLACPPGTLVATMAAHVATHLAPADFRAWATSDRHALLVAVDGGPAGAASDDVPPLLGYALVAFGEPDGAEERAVLRAAAGPGPYAELSKIYVHPQVLGGGVAARLLEGAAAAAAGLGEAAGVDAPLWLGTNGQNARAQAFYRKHGFDVAGTRTYDVGGVRHADVVMLRGADTPGTSSRRPD